MAREDSTSPCLHHSSINCLASGSATSLITACTAMTSIVPRCSRKPSVTGLAPRERSGRLRLLVDDAASSTSDRSLVSGRPGTRRAHDPARTARLRAASARGVVGRKPAFLATLPQADARALGRPSPRADAGVLIPTRLESPVPTCSRVSSSDGSMDRAAQAQTPARVPQAAWMSAPPE